MINNFYRIYENEINEIKNDKNTQGIFLVGSSKYIDLSRTKEKVSDIDIFVIVNEGPKQVRVIKNIEGIEFDINYFSNKGAQALINDKEYFFLKEMSEAKIIFDRKQSLDKLKELCKIEYNKGPKELSKEEMIFISMENLSSIQRLENKDKYDGFEYELLTNIYIKNMLDNYFRINKKWVPKDKKLISSIKNEDIYLFNLIKKVYESYLYKDLLNVYNYIFKNTDKKEIIKIIY